MDNKYQELIEWLRACGSVSVAYSGGVDSAFLVACAKEALGDNALAVIGRSPTYPTREYEAAMQLAKTIGIRCVVVDTDEMAKPEFASNPPNRCFHCKTTLFSKVFEVARNHGMAVVLEGSNADDASDYRPGMAAAREEGAKSPLLDLGFTKAMIRAYSKTMGLPTWNKPAMACLSSRIPYGETISIEKLGRIEQAENAIRDMGIPVVRVRDHGKLARVEVGQEWISEAAGDKRGPILDALKSVGYTYVCLDLAGYRTGAMNEALAEGEKFVLLPKR